jgi:hypothetical protein
LHGAGAGYPRGWGKHRGRDPRSQHHSLRQACHVAYAGVQTDEAYSVKAVTSKSLNRKPYPYPKFCSGWKQPDSRIEMMFRDRIELLDRRRVAAIKKMLREMSPQQRLCVLSFLDLVK